MNSSFYNGVSGIKVHQFGMDVWADNVANINNNGFKAVRPEFSNIFSQTLTQNYFSPAFGQVGLGASTQTTTMSELQGGLIDAKNDFDMAIKGEGWFGTVNKNGEIFYTRRGDFNLDADGNLVAKNGNFLLGTLSGNIQDGKIIKTDDIKVGATTTQTKLNFSKNLTLPAKATSFVKFRANLNPEVKEGPVSININEQDIKNTLDKDTNKLDIQGTLTNTKEALKPKKGDTIFVKIVDKNGKEKGASATLKEDGTWSLKDIDVKNLDTSEDLKVIASIKTTQELANKEKLITSIISPKGKKHTLGIELTKKVPHKGEGSIWDAVATIKDEKGEIAQTQKGVITFDKSGKFLSSTLATIPNGTKQITFDFGAPQDAKNVAIDSLTAMNSGKYGTSDIKKDGYIEGSLTKYQIDEKGYVQAAFDNGMNIPVAKIPLFHFQNDQGLSRASGDFYQETGNSGKAIFYTDKNGNVITGAHIIPKKLEASNVSLATALTEIIVMQKAFDASSKSITTSDQMIQRAINMKK